MMHGEVAGRVWRSGAVLLALVVGGLAVPEAIADDDTRSWSGAYLGVRVTEETDHPDGGARIQRVVEDSPADRAGLRVGDVIVGFEGAVVRGPVALTERIHRADPGQRVRCRILREGAELELEVELGERAHARHLAEDWTFGPDVQFLGPDVLHDEEWSEHMRELAEEWRERAEDWQLDHQEQLEHLRESLSDLEFEGPFRWCDGEDCSRLPMGLRLDCEGDECSGSGFRFRFGSGRPTLGVQLVTVTAELREHLGADAERGVLVSKVLEGTPAEQAGVAVGDLIVQLGDKPIGNVRDLRGALRDKAGETFDLEVVRDRASRVLTVTIPEPAKELPTGPRAMAPRTPGDATAARELARAERMVMAEARARAHEAQRSEARRVLERVKREQERERRHRERLHLRNRVVLEGAGWL